MSVLSTFLEDERVLIGLAVVSAALAIKLLSKKKHRLPPGPRVWPIIGTLPSMKNSLRMYSEFQKKYGDIYYVQFGLFGQMGTIVLNTMDLIREAYIHKQDDFAGRMHMATLDVISYGRSDIVFGDFTPLWRYQRKIFHAALRKYASGNHFQEILENSIGIVSDIFIKANGEPIDIKRPIALILYNIIASVSFGKKYELDDPEFVKTLKMLEDFQKNFTRPALGDMIPALKDIPTTFQKNLRRDMKEYIEFLLNIFADHRENFDKNDTRDVADYLVQINDELKENEEGPVKMEDRHFVMILSDMFLAGTDTSRLSLTWMLYFLAAFPEKQQKAQREIDDKIGKSAITTTNRIDIPYCEAILYETLRMRSPAPMAVPREATCDTSVGGYDVPKGMQVVPNLQGIHMNPLYWDNPEEFRPERFIDEEGNLAPKPENFLPFSTGRRQCVGEAFAKLELHTVIGMLLQRFTFEVAPGETANLDVSSLNNMPTGFNLVIKER